MKVKKEKEKIHARKQIRHLYVEYAVSLKFLPVNCEQEYPICFCGPDKQIDKFIRKHESLQRTLVIFSNIPSTIIEFSEKKINVTHTCVYTLEWA